MRFFHKTNIDFVAKRKPFFFLSISLIVVGIIITIISPPKFGIDFTGGTEIGVEFENVIEAEDVRSAVNGAGYSGSEIKSFGSDKAFLIRVESSGTAPDDIKNAFNKSFPNNPHQTVKVDRIGPKIGNEMRGQALWAILLSVIAIMIYIAFRFQFVFGLGAIVALIHDVLITFIFIVVFQKITGLSLEINQAILAGMLTVLGFSINDSVIIFDRIRENKEISKGISFVNLVNKSLNETLSRTVNTSITSILVLTILIFFGGESLQGFAFTMAVGFIVGTYSSLFIATPFVIWYLQNIKKQNVGKLDVEKVMAQ